MTGHVRPSQLQSEPRASRWASLAERSHVLDAEAQARLAVSAGGLLDALVSAGGPASALVFGVCAPIANRECEG